MFFRKIGTQLIEKPIYRFNQHCFSKIGANVMPKDVRTPGQIKATISELIGKNPDLSAYKDIVNQVEPKFWGLISDTLEISGRNEFLMKTINMNEINPATGKSALQALLEIIPRASKENPQALDFAQEVINNTDSTTSKYFLCELLDVITKPEYGRFFDAVKPMVKSIAEQTLSGGYLGTFKKQENFMAFIKLLVNPKNNIEKVKLLPKFHETIEEIPTGIKPSVYIDTFVKSNTPAERVSQNIDTLKEVAQLASKEGKEIDAVDFVNNNVNLV